MKAQAGKALPSQEGAPEGDNFDASFLTVRQPPTSVKDTPCSNFRGLDGCGGPRPLPDSPSKLKSPPTLDHSGGHPFLSSPFSGPKMSVHMKHLDPDSGTQPGHAVSLFAMGLLFPSLPCPPPPCPPPLPSPSAHWRGSLTAANRTCTKCEAVLQSMEVRIKHEEWCKGSVLANRTCSFCGKECGGFSSRMAHEQKCKTTKGTQVRLG